ncbi:Non-specific serine/threonine protein kinase [Bertholletia excelsa]
MGLARKLTATIVLLYLAIAPPPLSAQKLKKFSDHFGPFTNSQTVYYNTIFQVESPATISNDALQVTPDSASAAFNVSYLSGRIMFKQPFKLWEGGVDSKSNKVASFNSSFLINLYQYPTNSTPGEGLAFVIAPDLNLPPNSYGEYLGLTNATTDGAEANQLVAVELDTFKESFDPDSNHVGLNINGVRSNKTASLTPLGIDLVADAPAANFFVVWIQYDGTKKAIEVYIAQQETKTSPTPARPSSPVLRSDLDLQRIVSQKSYFGFSASTGNATQLNCVIGWNLTVEYFPEGKHQGLTIGLGVGIPVAAVVLVGLAALCYRVHKSRVARSRSNLVGALRSLPGTPREFKFRELKKATNNFDEKNKLGQGGFGVVYRGYLQKENLELAVKWFSRESIKGEDDFLAELTIINRLRHKHLVRLLGWCHRNGKLLLIYEYMPNGSLDQHLFISADEEDRKPLNWNLRYKIISGVASALHYLHHEYDQRVVHRDLKASNIMLDCHFNARLGDFGLARALDNEKTSYAEADAAGVPGTLGYIAPECFHTGKATQQSDVYAFGAVLLEVVSGHRPGAKIGGFHLLVDWVWSLHRDGRLLEAVDGRLHEDYVPEEAQRLLLLGLACSHPIASERPKTPAIVQIISGAVPVPVVPPFKPAFIWPAMPPTGEFDLSQATTSDTRSFATSHFESGWTPQYVSRESCTPKSNCSDNYNLV